LYVSGIDLLDGTPVLDIKPYIPAFDSIPGASTGWVSAQHIEEIRRASFFSDQDADRGGPQPRTFPGPR
jgi:hypothetical protein